MPYILYNRRGSGGFVVEATLALTGADYELPELNSKVGTPLPDAFRATNPWRQVPTPVLPDGTTMTETSAILIHLAACHPDRGLAPSPGTSAHGTFLRWIIFANINLYEAVLRRGYPSRFTDDEAGTEAVQSAAIRRMGEALGVIEEHIAGPFLLGPDMNVADIYIAMFYIWHRGEIDAPKLASIAQHMRDHSVVGPVWRKHFGDR